jgi:hypothetical protein
MLSMGITSHLSSLGRTGAISDELLDWQRDCNVFIQVLEELNTWPVEFNLFDDSTKGKLALSFSLEIVHALAAPQSGIHEACQTYALCYLAIALCHHRDSPRERSLFVGGLNSSFRELDDRSVASLAWLLVKGNGNEVEHTGRALQMLRVLWKLQAASKLLVKGFLQSFLDGYERQPLRHTEAAMAHIRDDVLSEAYGCVFRSSQHENFDTQRSTTALHSPLNSLSQGSCKAPLLSLGHLAQKGRNESHIL